MESKLKALKVVDLKDILARAQVSITSKANKSDLIAKILASPAALNVYKEQHDPKTALVSKPAVPSPSEDEQQPEAPPQDAAVPYAPSSPPKSVSSTARVPVMAAHRAPLQTVPPIIAAPPPTTPQTAEAEDHELAKRKARAARFNIPLVDPSAAKPASKTASKAAKPSTIDDAEALASRAARFGTQTTKDALKNGTTRGNKRSAPEGPVDPEEEERRRKRAERFGLAAVSPGAHSANRMLNVAHRTA
ncbi:hypothetical protein PHLCEN_2v351 [Hermanssonia centrifuga]|uniref:Uncharacterized protein n=1 Tax=Hermanssonia centrifuga TaxID=98765 RepID=A0A2R6S6L2_9APHY|nr:hypothetical protein PHLCEN_2v351 [Hermanssonia centrifuga]